jgi:hypothetical protein
MATDNRGMMMPGQIETSIKVSVENNALQVSATILDGKGVDRLIAILEQNKQFLTGTNQAVGT